MASIVREVSIGGCPALVIRGEAGIGKSALPGSSFSVALATLGYIKHCSTTVLG
jgi:hypothetical protein